jgi:hypothetical protein
VVAAWVASRVALVGLVALTAYLIGFDLTQRRQSTGAWLAGRFSWADSYHYLRIAEKGYLPPGLDCCDQAFFPGYPLAIRAVAPLVGGNLTVAGLVVAHLAALAAAVLLWRLGIAQTGDRRVGAVAVLLLAVAPYGVFLTSVFTESLFLALALGAWWTALRGQWWWAGLLAGLATGVRVNGLFLGAGLAVMYLAQQRADGGWRRPRPDVVALLAPLGAVAGYVTYLHGRTGSWTAWTDAQVRGWERRTAWPWQGVAAGWRAITDASAPDLVVAHVADLVFALAGVALVLVLMALRRWPEAVYLALSVGVLICSTTVQSSPRYALTWFPAYLLAAEAAVRAFDRRGWRWPVPAVVALALPVEAAVAVALAAHLWVA